MNTRRAGLLLLMSVIAFAAIACGADDPGSATALPAMATSSGTVAGTEQATVGETATSQPTRDIAVAPSATATLPAPVETPEPEATPEPSPTTTPSPIPRPTATPTVNPASGAVLYQADWSAGLDGWTGTSEWTIVSGILVNQSNTVAGAITAPFDLGDRAEYAIEFEMRLVSRSICDTWGPGLGAFVRGHYSVGWWERCQGTYAGIAASEQITGGDTISYDMLANSPNRPGPLPILDTDWHRYRIEVQSSSIALLVDDERILTVIDDEFLESATLGIWSNYVEIEVRGFRILTL